jgi:hypothetical protein
LVAARVVVVVVNDNARGGDKVVSMVPVKNYEVPNMSVMMHSFVPLLIRDKEHPMHK